MKEVFIAIRRSRCEILNAAILCQRAEADFEKKSVHQHFYLAISRELDLAFQDE